jgi:hypothetical protein
MQMASKAKSLAESRGEELGARGEGRGAGGTPEPQRIPFLRTLWRRRLACFLVPRPSPLTPDPFPSQPTAQRPGQSIPQPLPPGATADFGKADAMTVRDLVPAKTGRRRGHRP